MQRAVWQGSAGLTVPRQLREGSDFVLVRRTGKGRQQRVKTGFLTPAAPDKACGYPCPKGKGQVQSRPTSLTSIPQNPATACLLNTILEAGGSKASVFPSCHHQDFQGRAGLAWDTSPAHGCHPSPSSCWLGGGKTPKEQRKGLLMERNVLFSTQMSDFQEGRREAYGGDANQIFHGPQGTLWSRQKGCWPQEQHTAPHPKPGDAPLFSGKAARVIGQGSLGGCPRQRRGGFGAGVAISPGAAVCPVLRGYQKRELETWGSFPSSCLTHVPGRPQSRWAHSLMQRLVLNAFPRY